MAKDLTEALHQLTEEAAGRTTRKDRELPAGKTTTSIPDRVGTAAPKAPAATGGGIASPLTEAAIATRQYWPTTPATTYTSSDGLLVWEIAAIKQTTFADSASNPVVINWSSP